MHHRMQPEEIVESNVSVLPSLLKFLGILALIGPGVWLWLRRDRLREMAGRATGTRSDAPATGRSETASTGPQVNWLIGVGGDVLGKQFHIGTRAGTLGRRPANLVQVMDKDASRVHCRIRPEPGGLLLTDMNSSNGTYINGIQVKEQLLRPGDEIRIGEARLVFKLTLDQPLADDGQQLRQAGAQANAETAAAGSLDALVTDALRRTGGDTAKAAVMLGVPEGVVRQFLAQRR